MRFRWRRWRSRHCLHRSSSHQLRAQLSQLSSLATILANPLATWRVPSVASSPALADR